MKMAINLVLSLIRVMLTIVYRNRVQSLMKFFSLIGILAASDAPVSANPISGNIRFSGSSSTDASNLSAAVKLTAFSDVRVIGASGSYSEVPVNFGDAVYNAFDFGSTPAFVFTPIWTFTLGSGLETLTYSFDATAWMIQSQSDSALHLVGAGFAHITGFEDTVSAWDLKIDADGSFDFSTSDRVPEGGATAPLIGGAFVVVATLRRKFL